MGSTDYRGVVTPVSTRDDMTPLPELGDAFQAAMAPEVINGCALYRFGPNPEYCGLNHRVLQSIQTAKTPLRAVLHAIVRIAIGPNPGCSLFLASRPFVTGRERLVAPSTDNRTKSSRGGAASAFCD